MNLYRIDVRIYATAYIKAETEEEAQKLAAELKNCSFEMEQGYIGDGISIDDSDYQNLADDVSLSAAMTCYGPDEGDTVEKLKDLDDDDD